MKMNFDQQVALLLLYYAKSLYIIQLVLQSDRIVTIMEIILSFLQCQGQFFFSCGEALPLEFASFLGTKRPLSQSLRLSQQKGKNDLLRTLFRPFKRRHNTKKINTEQRNWYK